jgi:hypothetical protein
VFPIPSARTAILFVVVAPTVTPIRYKEPKPGKKPRMKRRRGEAVQEIADQRTTPFLRVDPLEALQEALDVLVADFRYCQSKVDQLPEDQLWRSTIESGKIPHEWIQLRDRYRRDIEHVSIQIARAGIADRAVKVQETQLLLVAQRVAAAAERAGLSAAQRRALGRELRAGFSEVTEAAS